MPTLSSDLYNTLIQLKGATVPSTPNAGFGRLWFKTDKTLHLLNDTGADIDLSALITGAMTIPGSITGDLVYQSDPTQLGTVHSVSAGGFLQANGSLAPFWSPDLTLTGGSTYGSGITLSTKEETIDFSASTTSTTLIPPGALILGASMRVLSSVTNSSGVGVSPVIGDVAGTFLIALDPPSTAGATTTGYVGTQPIVFTGSPSTTFHGTGAFPGYTLTGGVVRVTIHYATFTSPTS